LYIVQLLHLWIIQNLIDSLTTINEKLILSTAGIILNFNHNILQKRIDFEVSVVNHLNLFSYGLQKFLYPISFSINSMNGVVGLL
jgi:hypothetical protein